MIQRKAVIHSQSLGENNTTAKVRPLKCNRSKTREEAGNLQEQWSSFLWEYWWFRRTVRTAYVAGFIPQVSRTGLVTIDILSFIIVINPFLFPVVMDQKM